MKSKQFLKCRDYIFNFIQIPSIPAINNASGRGIRKLKIKLKNSGYFRSYPGTSIIETTKKHGMKTSRQAPPWPIRGWPTSTGTPSWYCWILTDR